MRKTVKLGVAIKHDVVIRNYPYCRNIDVDFYTEGEHQNGWVFTPEQVDELIQKLMQVKREAIND